MVKTRFKQVIQVVCCLLTFTSLGFASENSSKNNEIFDLLMNNLFDRDTTIANTTYFESFPYESSNGISFLFRVFSIKKDPPRFSIDPSYKVARQKWEKDEWKDTYSVLIYAENGAEIITSRFRQFKESSELRFKSQKELAAFLSAFIRVNEKPKHEVDLTRLIYDIPPELYHQQKYDAGRRERSY